MIKYKNFTLELAKEIQVAVLTIRDDFSANDEAKKKYNIRIDSHKPILPINNIWALSTFGQNMRIIQLVGRDILEHDSATP